MSYTTEDLYNLLPAIYRIRDAEQGEPLKALVSVIADQARIVEDDISQMYENWFIETCEEWVVPYLGDLLSVRNLHAFQNDISFSQRARVANTIAFRRRKGTATMLEQLVRDTTGWPARVVEFFELLGTTQYYNHIRLHNHRTPDLRDTNRLELLNTAFDTIAHSVDVRSISENRARYNIPNIGAYVWRLQSYTLHQVQARPAGGVAGSAYYFNPLGFDAPLLNRPQTETEITHLAEEINVPGRLRYRPLYDELEARRQALAEGRTPDYYLYFDDRDSVQNTNPVFQIFIDGNADPISYDEVLICNLENWQEPANQRPYTVPGSATPVDQPISVAVDPVRGRIMFPASIVPTQVNVSYAYGFAGDVGGGPYDRRGDLSALLERPVSWVAQVGRDLTPGALVFNTLTDAVNAWNTNPSGTVGLILMLDNNSYNESLTGATQIQVPPNSLLTITSATEDGQLFDNQVNPVERRAHLIGDISVQGLATTGTASPGELIIDGLLIEGSIQVQAGNLGRLTFSHCTIGMQDPDNPVGITINESVDSASQNSNLELVLKHSICGPLSVPETLREIQITDSILIAPIVGSSRGWVLSNTAGVASSPLSIERSTVIGSIHVQSVVYASESIFTESIVADRLQMGCVRFSYLPSGSRTPRRFQCQPSLALKEEVEAQGLVSVAELDPETVARILLRLTPTFTSIQYGNPAFGQLSRSCAEEILTGAENGSEMGVWYQLRHPQRIANLRQSLDEYLPLGLEAGLLFVT